MIGLVAPRLIHSADSPVSIVAAHDLLLAAFADGTIRGYSLHGPNPSHVTHQFDTIYPAIQTLAYSAWHDTVLTIEARRGDATGVVRVYYNWRCGTAVAPYQGIVNEYAAPVSSSLRLGGKKFPAAKELSVYRLNLSSAALAVSVCGTSGRVLVATDRPELTVWEVHPPYRAPPVHLFSIDCSVAAVVSLMAEHIAFTSESDVKVVHLRGGASGKQNADAEQLPYSSTPFEPVDDQAQPACCLWDLEGNLVHGSGSTGSITLPSVKQPSAQLVTQTNTALTALCTLLTARCSLHTAHCTLLTARCSLHTAHCTLLHIARCWLRCTLHTAHCTLLTARCCTLHAAARC